MSHSSEIILLVKYLLSTILLLIFFDFSVVVCDIIILNNTNSENLTSSIKACNGDEKCKEVMRNRIDRAQKFNDYIGVINFTFNAHHTRRLKHTSVVYGLIVSAKENQMNQQCYNEIMQIYHGINLKEVWAMKSELRNN